MCTKSELKDITIEIVKLYQTVYGDSLDSVYLYGSYARGDNEEDSDVDYVAIVNKPRETTQQLLMEIWSESNKIGLEHDLIISPSAIPSEDFWGMQSILPYYKSIIDEGVRVA